MSLQLAEQYEENEQYDKAYEEYKKSYESNPKDLGVLERLGHIAGMLGKKDEAAEYYTAILEMDATNIMAYEQLMDIYAGTDRYKYYIYRGNMHSVMHQLEHAINDFKKALNHTADNQEAQCSTRFVLGALYEQIGNTTKAIDEYLKVLDYDHTNEAVYLKLANLYMLENAPASAIETLERARKEGFDTDTIKEQLAQMYLKNNQPEIAKDITNDTLMKIKCLLASGNMEEASEEIQKNNDMYKGNADFYVIKAQYFYAEKDFDKALENVNEYEKFQPNTALGFQMKALIYEGKKDDYNSYLNWGKYNLARGNKDIAVNDFLNAYQLNETDVDLIHSLAILLESTGEKNHAVEFYEKLHRLEPTNKTALQKLADFRESIGDYGTQVDYLEQLLETDKRNTALIRQIGELHEKLRNKPEAVKYYQKYISITGDSPETDKIRRKLAKLENTEMEQEEGLIDKIMRFFNK